MDTFTSMAVSWQRFGWTYKRKTLRQLLTGVCQFNIQHWVVWHQLVQCKESHMLDQRSSHATVAPLTQPNGDVPRRISTRIPAAGCMAILTVIWRLISSAAAQTPTCWGARLHLAIVIGTRGQWRALRCHLLRGCLIACLTSPLMDSRCPAGFWTQSAWDVPNVRQLPCRPLRARHQQQAQTHNKIHSKCSRNKSSGLITPLHVENYRLANTLHNNKYTLYCVTCYITSTYNHIVSEYNYIFAKKEKKPVVHICETDGSELQKKSVSMSVSHRQSCCYMTLRCETRYCDQLFCNRQMCEYRTIARINTEEPAALAVCLAVCEANWPDNKHR